MRMSSPFLDDLREMLEHLPSILDQHRNERGSLLAWQGADFLPREILECFGIDVVRYPVSGIRGGCSQPEESDFPPDLFDFFVFPAETDHDPGSGMAKRAVFFKGFPGYGEDAAVILHASLDNFIGELVRGSLKNIDIQKLQAVSGEHNTMRRLVRGIASLRRESPSLFTPADLQLVFDAAMALPPALVNEKLQHLFLWLQEAQKTAATASSKGEPEKKIHCMVYGCPGIGSNLIEGIEELGLLVAEDDYCNGRRQFDLSINSSSEYVFYELLDALTYRPLCPLMRPPRERYDLLYRLLRNHGIGTVFFCVDSLCPARRREMEFLRVRLMRDGIDPVMTGNDLAGVKDYCTLAGAGTG